MRSYPHLLDRQARLAAVLTALGVVAVFAVALCLKPNVWGYGTHQQLGLPECPFLTLTGLRCPQCGMTTSFAHTVRGQVVQAWQANPFGPLLALILAVVVFPWSVAAALTGRSFLTRQPGMVMIWVLTGYLLCAIGIWLVRSIRDLLIW